MKYLLEGKIYYGERCAVIQREGDATATVSNIKYTATGIELHGAKNMLSLFDAFGEARRRGDEKFIDEFDAQIGLELRTSASTVGPQREPVSVDKARAIGEIGELLRPDPWCAS